MADPMKCEICLEREAKVFLTQIVDGAMTKTKLCDECAESSGFLPSARGQACCACGGEASSLHPSPSGQVAFICARCREVWTRLIGEQFAAAQKAAPVLSPEEGLQARLRGMEQVERRFADYVQKLEKGR